jgi:hypothetical protein
MLRSEIIRAAHNVVAALRESKVLAAFDIPLSSRPDRKSSGLLEAFQKYSLMSSLFSRTEIEIIEKLGLNELNQTEFWTKMFEESTERPSSPQARSELRKTYISISNALGFLPKFIALLQRPADLLPDDHLETQPKNAPSGRFLKVILPEGRGRLSSSRRLIMILEAIEILYGAVAALDGESTVSDLIVVSCDSGSDKVFDFTGISRILEKIESILLQAWDRIVFYRERKFSERVKLVIETLPLLAEINQLEQEQKIGQEQAQILRDNITKGVTMFLETGGRIPQMDAQSRFEPANLLQGNQTLLLAAPQEPKETVGEASPQSRSRARSTRRQTKRGTPSRRR